MSQVAILLTASIMFKGDVATAGTKLLVEKSVAADLFARGRAVPAPEEPLKLAELVEPNNNNSTLSAGEIADPDALAHAVDGGALQAISTDDQAKSADDHSGTKDQGEQQEIDLEKLELPQLRELCTEHGIGFAANASAKILREKLYAAFGGE